MMFWIIRCWCKIGLHFNAKRNEIYKTLISFCVGSFLQYIYMSANAPFAITNFVIANYPCPDMKLFVARGYCFQNCPSYGEFLVKWLYFLTCRFLIDRFKIVLLLLLLSVNAPVMQICCFVLSQHGLYILLPMTWVGYVLWFDLPLSLSIIFVV